MLRHSLISMLLWALPALATDKPASLQVCLTLPLEVRLYSVIAQPSMRPLEGGTWMLDFDLKVDGNPVERITKTGSDCFRVWLPAGRVSTLAFDFGRLPLNLKNQEQIIDIQLEAAGAGDAGRIFIERDAWSSVVNRTTGTLTFERAGFVMGDPKELPAGPYVLKFKPASRQNEAPSPLLQLLVDGIERPFVDGMPIIVNAGQRLELADLSLHAAR